MNDNHEPKNDDQDCPCKGCADAAQRDFDDDTYEDWFFVSCLQGDDK